MFSRIYFAGIQMRKLVLLVSVLALSTTAAAAADMAPRYTKAPVMVADPAYNWTGFYVGLNAGASWTDSSFFLDLTPCTLAGSCVGGRVYGNPANQALVSSLGTGAVRGSANFTGGGQIGYNWQVQRTVFGIEADFGYFDPKLSLSGTGIGTTGDPVTVSQSLRSDWLATVRGRLGYAWDRALLYVTGGVAISEFHYSQSIVTTLAAATGALNVSDTKVGWTVGAGFEYAMTPNWSVKGEYLYAEFDGLAGRSALVANDGSGNSNIYNASVGRLENHIARVGVNYRWGGPLVARP
jgi:outer membrane immunogenic protein